MTIDDAIEGLQRQQNSKVAFGFRLHVEALQLGIEALKAVKESRNVGSVVTIPLLPGETKA